LQAQYNNDLSEDSLAVAIKEMDVDGDSKITYDEFLTW
jgi:Ca2+-binding EF-hand superfamily protein